MEITWFAVVGKEKHAYDFVFGHRHITWACVFHFNHRVARCSKGFSKQLFDSNRFIFVGGVRHACKWCGCGLQLKSLCKEYNLKHKARSSQKCHQKMKKKNISSAGTARLIAEAIDRDTCSLPSESKLVSSVELLSKIHSSLAASNLVHLETTAERGGTLHCIIKEKIHMYTSEPPRSASIIVRRERASRPYHVSSPPAPWCDEY